jgi:hypothetical protein
METNSDKAFHYRERAAEARADAQKMLNTDMRRTLLDVAAGYELLASRLDVLRAHLSPRHHG